MNYSIVIQGVHGGVIGSGRALLCDVGARLLETLSAQLADSPPSPPGTLDPLPVGSAIHALEPHASLAPLSASPVDYSTLEDAPDDGWVRCSVVVSDGDDGNPLGSLRDWVYELGGTVLARVWDANEQDYETVEIAP